MADSKLSALTATTTLIDSDEIYVNDGGVSKKITKASFDDNIDIALSQVNDVTATAAEVNILDGCTATTLELNILAGALLSTAELNTLDGITATTAELNHTDGVTSGIQTQLDGKAPTSHATNGSTYGYGTASNAGHLRVGANLSVSTGTVSSPNASTSTKGSVELATSAEAAAGTDTSRVVTPSGLKYAFTSKDSLGTNGYFELPSGVIVQWGTVTKTLAGDQTYSFPRAFPSACLGALVCPQKQASSAPGVVSFTASTWVLQATLTSNTIFRIMAIGY